MYKLVISILFLVGFNLCPAQIVKEYRAVVVNDSGHPIEFCAVSYVNRNVGVYTDSNGIFLLSNAQSINDSLIFSFIGFKRMVISANNIKNNKVLDTIVLQQNSFSIDTLTILPEQFNIEVFNNKKNEHNSFTGSQGTLLVYHLTSNKIGYLKNVEFYLNNYTGKKGEIALRILEFKQIAINNNNSLTSNENIVLTVSKGRTTVRVDLTKYNILVPKEGILVGLEFLSNSSSKKSNSKKWYKGKIYAQTTLKAENSTYVSRWGRKWSNYTKASKNADGTSNNLKVSYSLLIPENEKK